MVAIFLGNRPATGYKVRISSFTDPRDKAHMVVSYSDVDPPAGSFPLKTLTRPFALLKIRLPLVVELLRDNGRYKVDRASPTVPAASEVAASDGRMQIALGVFRTRLKIGEPLRYRIAVKNVGTKGLEFTGPGIFWDTMAPLGISVEIQDQHGDPEGVPKLSMFSGHNHRIDRGQGFMGMTITEEDKLVDLRAQWSRQGLRSEQIADKTGEYFESLRKDHHEKGLSIEVLPPQMWIMPGGTAVTPTWVDSEPDRPGGKPIEPVVGFAEDTTEFPGPGKYRVRANTNLSGDMDVLAKRKKRKPGETVLRTPFIRIEVSR